MAIVFSLLKTLVSLLLAFANIFGIQFNATTSVDLYANPSSGYEWEYFFDETGILTVEDTYYTPDDASIVAGKGGGTQHFTFRALDIGTVNVTFQYVRYNGYDRVVASEYIYTFDVDISGTISLLEIRQN